MGVLGIGINLQLLRHCFAQFVFWQHSLDSKFNNTLWLLCDHLTSTGLAKATGITGVVAVQFLLDLVSLEYCLASVNNNDVLSHVEKRSPLGTSLSAKEGSHFRRQVSDRLPGCVYHVPFSSSSEFLSAGEVC